MEWHNLKDNKCPYCGDDISEQSGLLRCGSCRFVIEKDRYKKIVAHRGGERGDAPRLFWQYLRIDSCIICKAKLKEGVDRYGQRACSDPMCRFRISEERRIEIVEDPAHPANRFNCDPHEEQQT